ncbi:MAG: hypothetical protein WCR24_07330 [Candidatus Methanomethylophilaceae archaeon]
MISLPRIPINWIVYCSIFLVTVVASWHICESFVVVFAALIAVMYCWKKNPYFGVLAVAGIAALGTYIYLAV